MCNAICDTMMIQWNYTQISERLPIFHFFCCIMLLISSEFCWTIFQKGVEKPHRKAGTTELCLPGGGELILQFLPAIFGTLNGFNRCFNLSRKERLEISVCTNGEVEISSLERAVSSGLERLGGPEVSAARRPPLGSQNLNFCVNWCHLGITWWKTLKNVAHRKKRHVT